MNHEVTYRSCCHASTWVLCSHKLIVGQGRVEALAKDNISRAPYPPIEHIKADSQLHSRSKKPIENIFINMRVNNILVTMALLAIGAHTLPLGMSSQAMYRVYTDLNSRCSSEQRREQTPTAR